MRRVPIVIRVAAERRLMLTNGALLAGLHPSVTGARNWISSERRVRNSQRRRGRPAPSVSAIVTQLRYFLGPISNRIPYWSGSLFQTLINCVRRRQPARSTFSIGRVGEGGRVWRKHFEELHRLPSLYTRFQGGGAASRHADELSRFVATQPNWGGGVSLCQHGRIAR